MRLAAILVLAVALAGCGEAALDEVDATLPGVRTESFVDDEFECGGLLFAAGCVVVRVERVESGCSPQVPGYVLCNATLSWTATSGSLSPDDRLVTSINGTAGPHCEPPEGPGASCTVGGDLHWAQAFDGPGEDDWWNVTLEARLEGAPEAATGWFRLDVRMHVRTEPAWAADANA